MQCTDTSCPDLSAQILPSVRPLRNSVQCFSDNDHGIWSNGPDGNFREAGLCLTGHAVPLAPSRTIQPIHRGLVSSPELECHGPITLEGCRHVLQILGLSSTSVPLKGAVPLDEARVDSVQRRQGGIGLVPLNDAERLARVDRAAGVWAESLGILQEGVRLASPLVALSDVPASCSTAAMRSHSHGVLVALDSVVLPAQDPTNSGGIAIPRKLVVASFGD